MLEEDIEVASNAVLPDPTATSTSWSTLGRWGILLQGLALLGVCAVELCRTWWSIPTTIVGATSLASWALFVVGYCISWSHVLESHRLSSILWGCLSTVISAGLLLMAASYYGLADRGAQPDQVWTFQSAERALQFAEPLALTAHAQHFYEFVGMPISMIPGAAIGACNIGMLALFVGPAIICGLLLSLVVVLIAPDRPRWERVLYTVLLTLLLINRATFQVLYTFPYIFPAILAGVIAYVWVSEPIAQKRMAIISLLTIPGFITHFMGVFNLFPFVLCLLLFEFLRSRRHVPAEVMALGFLPIVLTFSCAIAPQHSMLRRVGQVGWGKQEVGSFEELVAKVTLRAWNWKELLNYQYKDWFFEDRTWFNFLNVAPLAFPVCAVIVIFAALYVWTLSSAARRRVFGMLGLALAIATLTHLLTDDDIKRSSFAGFGIATFSLVAGAHLFVHGKRWIKFVCLIGASILLYDSRILTVAHSQQYSPNHPSFEAARLIYDVDSKAVLAEEPSAVVITLDDIWSMNILPGVKSCRSGIPIVQLRPGVACDSSLHQIQEMVTSTARDRAIWIHHHGICDLREVMQTPGLKRLWESPDRLIDIIQLPSPVAAEMKDLMWSAYPYSQRVKLGSIWSHASKQAWGNPVQGRDLKGRPIAIGGKAFNSGICTHANSEFQFELKERECSLSFVAGIPDYLENSRLVSIQFSIKGDGKLLWKSPVLAKGLTSAPGQITIKNRKSLSLVLDQVNENNYEDHGCWADLRLTCASK